MIKKYKFLIVSLAITTASLLFADKCHSFLQSESAFSKTFKSPDFILLDFYDGAEKHKNPVGIINPDVVIISDDDCNRIQLATLINRLDRLGVRAIGIDHLFNESQPFDSSLFDAINRCATPIILASDLLFDTEKQKYTYINYGALANKIDVSKFAVSALDEPSITPQSIIRKVIRTYPTETGVSVNSFPYAVVKQSGIDSLLDKSIPQSAYIYFRNLDTPIIDWSEVLTCEENDDIALDIYDKIVLIGNTHNKSDMHMIPSETCLSGVEIQAASIYTYLHKRYITESKPWVNKLIAIISVFLFSILLYVSAHKFGLIGGLCVRCVQTFIIILFVFIGFDFYNQSPDPVYIDFSRPIMMIAISSFMYDVIKGAYAFVKIILKLK